MFSGLVWSPHGLSAFALAHWFLRLDLHYIYVSFRPHFHLYTTHPLSNDEGRATGVPLFFPVW